jgi:hypothetical protein
MLHHSDDAGRRRAVLLVKAGWHSLAKEVDDSGMRKVAMPAKGRQLCWQKEGNDATKEGNDGSPNGGGDAGKRKVVMLVKGT